MRRLIVSIGGAGQMVLHFYIQAFLAKEVSESFRAVIIDSDDLMPSLKTFGDFFAKVKEVGAVTVPELEYRRVDVPPGTTLHDALTASVQRTEFHPAYAFFASGTLDQDIQQGLFARPAISAVIAPPTQAYKVSGIQNGVVVGSIIGGTGGGLLAPVLGDLAREVEDANGATSLRALLFGEFFQPDSNRMPDARYRFPSNKVMVAQTLQQLAPEALKYFCFVEPDQRPERKTDSEKKAEKLPWPNNNDPYWSGVNGVEQLLTEAIRPAQPSFTDRELPLDSTRLVRNTVWDSFRRRYAIARGMGHHEVVKRLAGDISWVVNTVWGDPLLRLIRRAFEAGIARPQLELTSGDHFCRELNGALQQTWTALDAFFPNIADPVATYPADVHKTKWGEPLTQPTQSLTGNRKHFVDCIASDLLYRAMRGE